MNDRIIMVLTEESRWGSRVDFGVVEGFARETMASALEMFGDVSETFSRVVIFSKHDLGVLSE